MFCHTIVFAFCLLVVHGLNNIDYCQLECNSGYNKITHVVCERESYNCGPHKRCNYFLPVNMTYDLQNFIVNEHNKLRNKVALGLERRGTTGPQLAAANMKEFRYNEELGYIAQCWANTCQIQKHSYCNKASNLPYVGQNMALRSYSWAGGLSDIKMNLKLMITAWYDEVELFDADYIRKFKFDLSYGHYTQMIWGDAEEVGCGIALYTANGWYNIFLVCDYGSRQLSGNVRNHAVYKVGKPCSQCPRGTECSQKYKGLCTKIERITNYKDLIYSYANNFGNYYPNNTSNIIITYIIINYFINHILLHAQV